MYIYLFWKTLPTHLVQHCDYKCVFPSQKQLINEHLPTMLVETMEKHVLPTIAKCATTTTSFNLWMYKFGYDTSLMTNGSLAMLLLHFFKLEIHHVLF